jgi:uncharacterized protein
MFDYDLRGPQYSPWSQLAILLLLSGVGLLIGSFVCVDIAKIYLRIPLQSVPDALKNIQDANLARLTQFVFAFFFMALPSFFFARIISRSPFKYIGYNSAISGKQVFIVIGIMLAGLFLSGALGEVNKLIPLTKSAENYFKGLEDEYDKQVLLIANMKSVADYIISIIMIALMPALFEEILFRGALQPVMIKLTKNAFAGILLTSILFSAIHLSYYGFLPRLALGLIIGYVFYFSKNLWLSSLTHFLYNLYGISEVYALSRKGLITPDDLKDDSFPLFYGLIAAIAIYVIFIFFKKESEVVISTYNLREVANNE